MRRMRMIQDRTRVMYRAPSERNKKRHGGNHDCEDKEGGVNDK